MAIKQKWLELRKIITYDSTVSCLDCLVECLKDESIEVLRGISSKQLKKLRAEEWNLVRNILREWIAHYDAPFKRDR